MDIIKKKIFTISDIHGHYIETIKSLKEAGWDENNSNHLLIVCGDLFDRGSESLKVYLWLKRLCDSGKAIIIQGNHEPMFVNFLEGSYNTFDYKNNGLRHTIDSFAELGCLGGGYGFQNFLSSNQSKDSETGLNDTVWNLWVKWCDKMRNKIKEEYPELLVWLKSLPFYYETKNYIFTHGAIDGTCPDWHHPHKDIYGRFMDWEACAWDDGSFFNSSIVNTDKTVVIGHYGTSHLREKYNIEDYLTVDLIFSGMNKYSILVRNDRRVVAIDGTTILSKQVNVLVIENEELIID